MTTIANIAVLFVAFLHLCFLVLEMFFWDAPLGLKLFGMAPEYAATTKTLAANQGLYNGIFVAGLLWSLWLGAAGYPTKIFFLVAIVAVGMFGGWTVSRKILWVQAFPGLVAMALVLLSESQGL